MRDATKVVRETIDSETGAITTPIYQTTAYLYPEGEKYRYSREANPTVLELAKKIAELENAEQGIAFSSGMGAISTTALALLRPNNNVLIHRDMFGRSYRFFMDYLKSWGVNVDAAYPGNENILNMAKSKKYDLIFIESITNPILKVIDIIELSKIAKEQGSILVVDSTFATPINQKPLELGADIVVHSASKFISG
ncbi:MAG: aminotransferase class I/II-fold pyridoxal phosphate-dependent enzyme, partial [Saccharolobus sp.]